MYYCHPKDERLCHFCSYNVVGNEAHFVLECLLYNYFTRERFPSLFKNVMLGSLKSFYELDILTLIIPFSVCYYMGVKWCYNILKRMQYSTKQSHLCSIMSKHPVELLLIKIELMIKILLHCVIPNSNMP